jgi:N-acetyl-alpha-D-glucosaminyl L-malate synthase BshA
MSEVAVRYGLDLLHVHYAIPHSVSAYLAKQILEPATRLPVVTTLHGTDITLVGIEQVYFPITRYAIENSDGITAISHHLAERTREVFEISRPIRVIPNFVNCDLYRPDPAKKDRSQGEKTLIHISNFRKVKRATDCVRILHEVRRRIPARLLMVGDGPEVGAAEQLAAEIEVSHAVDFLGSQLRVDQILPSADVLLLPSEMESFGLVALEGMACGVPAVATRTGGVPELISDGVDGFLDPVGDIPGQAKRVVRLLSDSQLYEKMSAAARNTAKEKFDTSQIIPQYERYYEELCERTN